MMSELRRIVVRFFVAIRNRVKDCIIASTIGLLLAFFTYTKVVDWLNIEEQALKIIITILVFSLSILFALLRDKFIGWILKYRKWSLLGAAVLGLGLATGVLILINKSGSDSCTALYEIITFFKNNQVLVSSITILALGLPTFFTLWVFRTHDVQEQIKKTEENTNNSTFFECVRMLIAETLPESDEKDRIKNSFPKKVALEQLAYLKRETGFDKKRIDLLIRNLSLNGTELNYAQLSDIDLSGAKLKNTSLIEADLRDAKLIDANLSRDKTKGQPSETDLSRADLRGADLSGAIFKMFESSVGYFREADLDRARYDDGKPILEGAKYNSEPISTGTVYIRKTIFPYWLDSEEKREEAKMIDISAKQGSPQK